PNHFEARLYLALALSQESLGEAAEHLKLLHKRDPANDQVRLPLAVWCRTLGQWEEAKQLLDEILKDEPDWAPVLVERGLLALDMQEVEAAEHFLRQAHQIAPESPEANLALAGCLRQKGKAEEAEQCLNKYRQLEAEFRRKTEGTSPKH